jgi:hypothetical protein
MSSSSRHYAGGSITEFGNEICRHVDSLAPQEFLAMLDQYDPSETKPNFEGNLESFSLGSEKACCDLLNSLLNQVQCT